MVDAPSSPGAARVGAVLIPHLPLALAVRQDARAAGRPVLVSSGPGPDAVVVDAADACLAAGIRLGQPLASALAERPDVLVLPHPADAVRRAHGMLLDLIASVVPAVEEVGLGRAYFGLDPAVMGEAEPILVALRVLIRAQLGLSARVAAAPGKFPAQIVVEHDPRAAAGQAIVLGSDTPTYLAPLEIGLLPLEAWAGDRLRLLGIRTIGQVARLPREGLVRRFGRAAPLAHQLARGIDPRPLQARSQPRPATARYGFDPPVETLAPLLAVADRLLDRLCRDLHETGRLARRLEVAVDDDGGNTARHTAPLRQPTNQPAACRTTLRTLVEALARDRSVATLAVTLAALGPATDEQLVLIDQVPADATRRAQLTAAIDEATKRYPHRLQRVQARATSSLLDEHLFTALPLGADPADPRPAAARPLTRARPVDVVRAGTRLYLVDAGVRDELVLRFSAWQADAWWPEARSRRYLRVQTRSGRICTLSQDAARWRLVEELD